MLSESVLRHCQEATVGRILNFRPFRRTGTLRFMRRTGYLNPEQRWVNPKLWRRLLNFSVPIGNPHRFRGIFATNATILETGKFTARPARYRCALSMTSVD